MVERDAEGNAIFDLNRSKKVVVKKFKGQVIVDIRETFEKDGKTLFTKKGVGMTHDTWEKFKSLIPIIDKEVLHAR